MSQTFKVAQGCCILKPRRKDNLGKPFWKAGELVDGGDMDPKSLESNIASGHLIPTSAVDHAEADQVYVEKQPGVEAPATLRTGEITDENGLLVPQQGASFKVSREPQPEDPKPEDSVVTVTETAPQFSEADIEGLSLDELNALYADAAEAGDGFEGFADIDEARAKVLALGKRD